MTVGLHADYLTETLDSDGHPSDFTLTCPPDFNFAYDVVDRLGRETPQRRALRWCDDEGSSAEFSFADVARLSDAAAAFLAREGVRKGDRVLVILKRHPQFWWTILGLHKIGAIAIPATNLLKAYDLVFRLNEAHVSAIVCTMTGEVADEVDEAERETGLTLTKFGIHGGAPRFDGGPLTHAVDTSERGELRPGWTDFDAGVENLITWNAPIGTTWTRPQGDEATTSADPMLLYFTSGTTAQPKMVLHDFSYPIGHIPTAKYWQRVDPEGLHLTVSETGWAKAVWGKLYGQWLMETCVDVFDFDRFDPERLLAHLAEAKVTSFCAAPTVYRFLVKSDLSSYDLSSLQHATIAGEAMNPVVYETFRERTGIELKEAFGQTESTPIVVTPWWKPTKAGSMGLPSPAYQVALLNADGSIAPPGVEGEICVRAASPLESGHGVSGPDGLNSPARPIGLFLGYADDPVTTASAWHDGYYHTRDLAVADEDGYFWYVGRTDDMIKTSGYRVGPFEVESVVMAHPAVVECAITAAPDPQGIRGTVIKATIVPASGYSPSPELARDIQNFVKQETAPYKYPRIVEFVETMPVTISGKIRRVEIRQRDELSAVG
ncbi:MAG: AMP-binding protein [Propionibacteriaceae bacterium]|nr:AMP-binding protein [Propionibacteriaceae bacterium]